MTLLSVEEARRLASIPSTFEDDDVTMWLDAAEQEIDALYGPVGSEFTDVMDGIASYVFLRRRALTIAEVTESDGETDTILADDDYRLRGDGVSVLRLATGTNPRTWWGGPVSIKYAPADDEANRKRVQLALVQLDVNNDPGGATSERIGEWAEERSAGNSAWNYAVERAAILESLGALAGSAPGFA